MIKNWCADRIDARNQCTYYPRQAAAPNLSQQRLDFFLRGRISQPAKPIHFGPDHTFDDFGRKESRED
jgi:hypothetical protein